MGVIAFNIIIIVTKETNPWNRRIADRSFEFHV